MVYNVVSFAMVMLVKFSLEWVFIAQIMDHSIIVSMIGYVYYASLIALRDCIHNVLSVLCTV